MQLPEAGSVVDPAHVRAWDPDLVNWDAVRASVIAHRDECDISIAQIDANIRGACRPPKLREQELRAALSENMSVCDQLVAVIDAD